MTLLDGMVPYYSTICLTHILQTLMAWLTVYCTCSIITFFQISRRALFFNVDGAPWIRDFKRNADLMRRRDASHLFLVLQLHLLDHLLTLLWLCTSFSRTLAVLASVWLAKDSCKEVKKTELFLSVILNIKTTQYRKTYKSKVNERVVVLEIEEHNN